MKDLDVLFEGIRLMGIGMFIVFLFLFLLMIYLKLVPILSNLKGSNKSNLEPRCNTKANNPKRNNPNDSANNPSLHNYGTNEQEPIPEIVIAAIAAAIYKHTKKKQIQLLISKPGHMTEYHEPANLWGIAGRQDIMQSRDIVGQVGFQY